MTEDQVRQVVLVQALEAAAAATPGAQADADWATRQALAAVGESAGPERFVVARAGLALQRLLPRDAAASRWLHRRLWHGGWLPLALLLGAVAGVLIDQLGPPQTVNLLAPAVWAVVAWNGLVYALLALPSRRMPWREATAARLWLLRVPGPADATARWVEVAAPLARERLTLLMHAAAAALAAGLVAGLYLRGLVLDYRAGWQSTFADAATVQAALGLLLAPASALTGVAVPDVAPLRLAPGQPAQASAAPWIHLYAATLVLAVLLPRAVLAARAGWRAWRLARALPLALDTPYFEALHPLMRPASRTALRLLWVAPAGTAVPPLFGTAVPADARAVLFTTDAGDRLELCPLPPAVAQPAPVPAWRRWLGLAAQPSAPAAALRALREQVDAVLHVAAPDSAPPPWLADLARPVVHLHPGDRATAPAVALHARDDGWLREGRLLSALDAALGADARWARLAAAWRAHEAAALQARCDALAAWLAEAATARAELERDDAAAESQARTQLTAALAAGWQAALAQAGLPPRALPPATVPTLHARVPEGRAALVGGAATGALTGLKADLASGGLTMGAGLVTGAVLGALGSAGLARGVNSARGTTRSHLAWSPETLTVLAGQAVAALCGRDAPGEALPPLPWPGHDTRADAAAEALRLRTVLAGQLANAVRATRGGP